jgi:hypothetical protein
VLRDVNETYPDCTLWLDYFTEGVELSLHRVKERILLLSGDERRKATAGQLALTERQMRIVEFIHDHESVKTHDLVLMFHISRQAALMELNSMIRWILIVREGIRKNSRYVSIGIVILLSIKLSIVSQAFLIPMTGRFS